MLSKRIAMYIILAITAVAAYYWWYTPRYGSGEVAPDFEVTLIDGRQAKLSDLRGKVTLLQFWGSWCGPCRAENRWLVPLYEKYNAQGFEIFSVGLETNEDRWKNAMQQDGMLWPYHTADFNRLEGDIAKAYKIHDIPATFLINKVGEIVVVNEHDPAAMEVKLVDLLR